MGEVRGDVGKGEGREMWGIKSVLGQRSFKPTTKYLKTLQGT